MLYRYIREKIIRQHIAKKNFATVAKGRQVLYSQGFGMVNKMRKKRMIYVYSKGHQGFGTRLA
jgi:hypothetical protein